MSYTVLARRYRSTNFDELIGQEHIAQTLKKAITSGRIAHAYLFCGTRGTGKTSTARILAKCLNCESSDKATANPCGKCESCKAIARGDDIDVIEIDAASNTGVDNVRDLIANSQFHPARSRYKVYIIDEVHMLSKAAFNALLKTLEEPPEHVKFILATTEPEKVLPTILSRCQRYDFRNIPTREIAEHLKDICKQEKIKADEDALFLVAKAGAGSMRDSLSLLDRLLSVGEKELTVDMIEQLLGLPKSQLVFDLAQSIGEADVKQVLTRADKIIAGGLSPDLLIASLIDHLRNLLILRTCGPDSTLVEVPGLAMKDLAAQAGRFDPVVLTQDITLLEELRRQLRTSQAGRALLDASLVRLALADQFNQIGDLLTGAANGEAAPAVKKKFDEAVSHSPSSRYAGERGEPLEESDDARLHAPPAPLPSPLPASGAREQDNPPADDAQKPETASPATASTIAVADNEDEDDDLPAVGKVWDNSGPSLAEMLKQRTASATSELEPEPAPVATTNVEAVDVHNLPELWQKLLDALAARGPAIHSIVSQGRLACIEDGRAIIRYEKKNETFVKMLDRNGKRETVSEALTLVSGASMGVRFEVDEAESVATAVMIAPPPPKPEPARAPVRAAVPEAPSTPPPPVAPVIRVTDELVESLRQSEPLIKGLMDELGAKIIKIEAPEASV